VSFSLRVIDSVINCIYAASPQSVKIGEYNKLLTFTDLPIQKV